MNNTEMDNQTELDWLARNVHEWPGGDHQDWCFVGLSSNGRDMAAWSGHFGLSQDRYTRIEKHQFLTRRAELQNKPSWADAPEWAEWLAQVDGGSWFFCSVRPDLHEDGKSWFAEGTPSISVPCVYGKVLGDWRDTLEKRPETKPLAQAEVELVNAVEEVFQPFTSIEDKQEQVMEQKVDQKQDNSWFERGELPPVGTRVDVDGAGLVYGDGERNCEVLAHVENTAVVRMSYGLGCFQPHVMLPSRTERDELMDVLNRAGIMAFANLVADAILAAGYRKESK